MSRLLQVLAGCVLGAVPSALCQQYTFLPIAGSPKEVVDMFEDSKGRLWLAANPSALFDGSRFYYLRDYGFPENRIYEFAEDSAGTIWIAAATGVYRYAGGRVEEVAKGTAISIVAPSADTVLAAVGAAGKGVPASVQLVRIRGQKGGWSSEPVMPLDSPNRITLDSSGMLLFPWPAKGWNEVRVEDVLHWTAGPPPKVLRHEVPGAGGNGGLKVMRGRTGCVWMGVTGGNSYNCGDGWQGIPFDHSYLYPDMHEAADGTMVLWGGSVLKLGRPGRFRTVRPVNGLPALSNAVQARDGTVWLGTPQGLFRFAGGLRAEYWTVREGPETPPWSFARVGERIYAGLVDQIVVLSADRRRWEPFVSPAGGDVTSLLATDDGTLLAATMYGGAGQYARDGRLLAHTEKNLPGGTSMRLAKGPAGDVWLGGNELGRLRREGTVLRFEKHFLSDQRHGNVLSVVSEDHTQKLWACYTGGVVVRDQDGSWREITTKNGLQANGCWSLAPLPNGDVWDAYDNQSAIGLIRPLAQSSIAVRQYGPESLPDAATVVLSPDALGRLWRGGGAASYAATPATAEAGNWLKLDGSDGLRPDMNSGSFFSDSDGSVWFGADNDIAHYSPPGDLLDPKFAPEVSISAFSWDGAAPRLAEGIGALPYAKNAVAHIGSLQFDRRNALKIRYRILPGQQNWQESKDLDVPLDSSKSGALSPGSHSLEVQGRVFTGPWSSTVRRNFVVLAPVWRTWPWIGAYVTGLALIVSGVVVMRRRRREEDALLMPDLAAARIGALLPDAEETQGITLDGRFEVGIMIARGGFANVMEGYDRESKQRCAIKVFRREVATKEWVQRRFEQEVAALQRIQHPNVVSIYAFGSIPTGAPYLVMEFIEGVDLRELLLTGPLPRPRIAGLLRQLGDALAAIHAQNICHRDITPENIIVRRPGAADEQPVLIDFSIAIVKDANETMYGLSRAAGTFDYMAPEQALGYAEPSSDIYGLTRVFVEMLTGRRMKALLPDAAIDLPQRLRHLLRELNCGLSEESLDLLASAQEFDPVKRPSDVSAFVRPVVRDLLSPGPGRPGNATT